MSKINPEELKFLQIEAAFRQIKEHGPAPGLRDVYEFGVYRGDSLKKICGYLKENKFSDATPFVFGFDSWEGLPKEAENKELFEKFFPGAYKYTDEIDPLELVRDKVDYDFLYLVKSQFSDLKGKRFPFTLSPALLVHIDCDIYISTIYALEFLFDNKIIREGTLIAYDEYRCTDSLSGEEAAHLETMKKYGAEAEEVFHYTYRDKTTGQKIRQSVWEITKIG